MGITRLLTESIASGSFMFYVAVFVSGLIASIAPCTYPVLPLTVGYIGGAAKGKKSRGFILSLALVFGMACTYGILGAILAALGLQFGIIWSNGWAVYGIAMFFILMGLFLLDVFTFPTTGYFEKLRAKVSQDQEGLLGAFLVGAVGGLIVGPCTGPILAIVTGAIIASLQQAEGLAFAGLLVKAAFAYFLFGLGQGALIIVCGTFAGLLAVLPKSGKWLVTVKKTFALIVIVGASLLLVYVGQETNFPSLISILASFEATTEEPVKVVITEEPAEEEFPDVEKAFEEMEELDDQAGPGQVTTLYNTPDFTAAVYGDGTFDSSQVLGSKPVIFVFFATWCPYCMAEVPTVENLYLRGQKEGFLVYGINYQQTEDVIRKFYEEKGVTYPVVMDTDGEIAQKYRVFGIPYIVGIDSSGTIRVEGTEFPEDMDAFIKKLKGD